VIASGVRRTGIGGPGFGAAGRIDLERAIRRRATAGQHRDRRDEAGISVADKFPRSRDADEQAGDQNVAEGLKGGMG
jgi:hypothetical protein